jgi:ribosome-interacting GTPase 1
MAACVIHMGEIWFGHSIFHSPFVISRSFPCTFISKVPAFLNVVDIAGLVRGAADGVGLGNSFLSHISACDGIFHLCREYIETFYVITFIFYNLLIHRRWKTEVTDI